MASVHIINVIRQFLKLHVFSQVMAIKKITAVTKLNSKQEKQQEKEEKKGKNVFKRRRKQITKSRGVKNRSKDGVYASTVERGNKFSEGPEMMGEQRQRNIVNETSLQTQDDKSQREHAS